MGRTWLPVDFADFKRKRNKATNLMYKSREEFYSKFIEENGTDRRKLFYAAKKLLGTSDVLNFPVHEIRRSSQLRTLLKLVVVNRT